MDSGGVGADGVSELERAAMKLGPMPAGLQPHDQVQYLGLRYLYGSVKRQIITRGEASTEKRAFLSDWKKAMEGWAFEKKCWESSARRTMAAERALSAYRLNRTMENADVLQQRLDWLSAECARPVIPAEHGATCPACGKPFEQAHADRWPAFCEDCGCRLYWGEREHGQETMDL